MSKKPKNKKTEEEIAEEQLFEDLKKIAQFLEMSGPRPMIVDFTGNIALGVGKYKTKDEYVLTFQYTSDGDPGRELTEKEVLAAKANPRFLTFRFTDSRSIDSLIYSLNELKKKMNK